MTRLTLTLTAMALAGVAGAQLTFRNAEPVETDSQGHVIEKLDYDRKISVQEGDRVPTAAEYRAELKERERMKKVAQEVGPWFDAIQRLEIDQKKAEEEHADDGGGVAGDGAEAPPGQSGAGMLAYIEAIRLFNTDTSEGGKTAKEAKQLKAALEELLYRRGGEVLCGPGHGVSLKWPLELLLVRYQSWKAQSLPIDELYAAKSADLWPGKVPEDAERVRKKVRLYPGEGGWISTGLYVPPGEVITIDCGSLTGNLTAQIGCHTDNLPPKIVPLDEDGNPMDDPYDPQPINLMKVKMGWQQVTDNRPLWRWPLMTRSFRIEKKREEIGHVLGGVLWFKWSGGKRPMDVEVSGCVQMPWFRLGIDTDQDWVETISKYPAPWAEIQTKTVILTVPSEDVRHITRMEALAQWWGKAAALMLRLSGHGLPTDSEAANYRGARREWGVLNKKLVQMTPDAPPDTEELVRAATVAKAAEPKPAPSADGSSPHDYGIEPEPIAQQPVPQDPRAPRALKKPSRENEPKFTPIRIVDDTQINLGAGHSGYPIMCLDWGGGMMNLESLQKHGSWGALHEIGHNMDDGGRATIFSLPGDTEVVNNFYSACTLNMLNGTPFPAIRSWAWPTALEKLEKGTPDLWQKASVAERLVFYMTLAHVFGVEGVYHTIYGKNDKLPSEATGDRLCCAWSRAVKRDLTPYFEMWGLGLSKATYTFTQDWPPWPANDEDKQAILSIGSEASNSRYGISQEAYANPEDVKTRRQLRVRPTLRKSKADDK